MLNIMNHWEMPIKTTVRYHLTPITMTPIEKNARTSVGKDVEKLKPCTPLAGM